MARVLVLYYSTYGHTETMANAVAEGARSAGATVDVKRVPETVPREIAEKGHFKLDQVAPVATVEELENYDAIVIGTGTRYGRMSSQMAAFLDQTSGLWLRGALNGKVGAAFVSTGTQHGGQETTLFSLITNLMHLGMVIVGLPYSHQGQMTLAEVVGGVRLISKARVTKANSLLRLLRSCFRNDWGSTCAARCFSTTGLSLLPLVDKAHPRNAINPRSEMNCFLFWLK